jgi:hypothetical protein
MGPEGGSGGGKVVVTGTPEQVALHATSHTARFLKPLLGNCETKLDTRQKVAKIAKQVPAKKPVSGKSVAK